MPKITIVLKDEDKHPVFEGDVEVQLSPGNALLVVESNPDVTGKSPTGKVGAIKMIVNPNKWEQVMIQK